MKRVVFAVLIFSLVLAAIVGTWHDIKSYSERAHSAEKKFDWAKKVIMVSGSERWTDEDLIFDDPKDFWLWMLGVMTFCDIYPEELYNEKEN